MMRENKAMKRNQKNKNKKPAKRGIRLSATNFMGQDTDIQEEPREIYSIDSAQKTGKMCNVSTR